MTTACRAPVAPETLLAYWLGELDAAQTEAVDLHLLGCDRCGAEVDALAALGEGVRAAFDAGRVGAVVHARFTQHLADRGLRVREYRVPAGASVDCSIGPADDVLVSRLGAQLAGIERLDMIVVTPGQPERRAADIPFDAAADEVVVAVPAARVRELPDCIERVRLVAVDGAGVERLVGDYAFNHRAGHP